MNIAARDSILTDWNELLCETITDMAVLNRGAGRFEGVWRHYRLGPVDLNFISATPQVVFHGAGSAASMTNASFDLVYLKRGTGKLRHHGKSVIVPEGGLVLLDNTRDYEFGFGTGSLGLTVHIGEAWLRRWTHAAVNLIAHPLMARNSWGYPLTAMLEVIASQGLENAALPRETIADQLGSFIALTAEPPDRNGKTTRYTATLLERIKAEMHDLYDDPELSPAYIADRAGISKRHLHGLFAQAGTTFNTVLLNFRLQQAAAMLSNPRYTALQIGEIARQSGFVDQSHFAKRFRQRYGVSPKHYRLKA